MEVNMYFHRVKVMRIQETFFVIKNQDPLEFYYFYQFNLLTFNLKRSTYFNEFNVRLISFEI